MFVAAKQLVIILSAWFCMVCSFVIVFESTKYAFLSLPPNLYVCVCIRGFLCIWSLQGNLFTGVDQLSTGVPSVRAH